ncbi:Uncharacterised protein [Mycobacteroides abscessus subsp. abscessus]|nr:Uncharacterised protein [Mycobacteroides abscessus subsp. abscessus]
MSGSIATQPGHDRGEDRDADNPVGQLQDHPGLAIDDRAGFRGTGGDPVRDDIPELTDGHVREHGGGHSAELFEAVVEPPQGAQGNLLAPNRRQQHHGLGRHTERGADAQYQQLRVAHPDRVEGELTRHQPVQHEGGDRHQVVPHRRPSGRTKHVAGVQNRHEQRAQAVEEDLRQEQVRQRRGERRVHLGIATEHDPGQQWCGQHREQCRHQQQRRDNGEQLAYERLATVGVFALGTGEHRDENRREGGLKHQRGNDVGQGVGS